MGRIYGKTVAQHQIHCVYRIREVCIVIVLDLHSYLIL